jgi:crossover junction endodeoxyribonuclease RuvC
MPTNQKKILAIDPGTREMGVAVLEGQALLYYGVKNIRGQRNPATVLRRIQEVITGLIERFRPDCLATEKVLLNQKNASLLVVTAEEIKATARQHNLAIYEYVPSAVRKAICGGGRATKQQTARVVAQQFPELRSYLEQKTKWETLYYANMFDAIAVGLNCAQEMNAALN